jgi:iron complex outermembrane receptor protein
MSGNGKGVLRGFRGALLCGVAALISWTAVAMAVAADQSSPETPQAGVPSLEEVVVTARRRSERLEDVPLTVTAFSGATVNKLSVYNTEDLNKLDPALVMGETSGVRTTFQPFIRGLGTPAIQSTNPVSDVVTYFAEVPNLIPSFYDLSSIQVLKGIQGTLFGETANAGAILISPQRPTNDLEGYVSVEGGNYNYGALEGALNMPIIADRWMLRVSAQARDREGYVQILYPQSGQQPVDGDNLKTSNFRVSNIIRPTDNFEIYTIFSHDTVQSNGSDGVLSQVYNRIAALSAVPSATPATASRYLFYTSQQPPAGETWYQILQGALAQQQVLGVRAVQQWRSGAFQSNTSNLANTVTWNVADNITLKNISGIQQVYGTAGGGPQTDGTNVPVRAILTPPCVPGNSRSDCFTKQNTNWSNESQVQGIFLDRKLNVQGGLYVKQVNPGDWITPAVGVTRATPPANTAGTTCSNYNVGVPSCILLTRNWAESYAGYFQGTYEVVPDIHLTAGVRKTYDKTWSATTAGAANNYPPFMGVVIPEVIMGTPPLPGANYIKVSPPTTGGVNYTFAADWKIDPNTLVYATTRQGYKGGGVNTNLLPSDPNFFFQPETVRDVEAGFKKTAEIGGVAYRADVSAYYEWYTNIQRATQIISAQGQFVSSEKNVGAAAIKGIELALQIIPSRWFDVGLSWAFNDAKFTKFPETSNCATDFYVPGCTGVANPGAIPVIFDHVAGTVVANGVLTHYGPDRFAEAPLNRWSVKPALHLGFLGDVLSTASISGNVYGTSSYTRGDEDSSNLIPPSDYVINGYVLADMRFDWTEIVHREGLHADYYAVVTNVANKTAPITKIMLANTIGVTVDNYTQPRMFFTGVRVRF